jgi:hypothetical protein
MSELEAWVRRSRKVESSFGSGGETGSVGEVVEELAQGAGGGWVGDVSGGCSQVAVVGVGVEPGCAPAEGRGSVAVGVG